MVIYTPSAWTQRPINITLLTFLNDDDFDVKLFKHPWFHLVDVVSATPRIHVWAAAHGPPHLFLLLACEHTISHYSLPNKACDLAGIWRYYLRAIDWLQANIFNSVVHLFFTKSCQALISPQMCSSFRSPVSRCMVPTFRLDLFGPSWILTPGTLNSRTNSPSLIVCHASRWNLHYVKGQFSPVVQWLKTERP